MDERVSGGGTRTLIWDMLDLSDPVLVTEFRSDQASIDHNLYIKDGLALSGQLHQRPARFGRSRPAQPGCSGIL